MIGSIYPMRSSVLMYPINSLEPYGRTATLVNESGAGIPPLRQYYIRQDEPSNTTIAWRKRAHRRRYRQCLP